AGSVEAQLCVDLAALPALCVVGVPIMATRHKDVRRERVMFGFRCRKLSLNIVDRRSEPFECVLKACGAHECSCEHFPPAPVNLPAGALEFSLFDVAVPLASCRQ